jgi:predicted lipoprotein with Yx(FWY)xxD motif
MWPARIARRRAATTAAVLILIGAGALALAGCGGSSSSGGGGGSSSGSGSGSSSATVTTKNISGYGTALTTSSGQALYLLTADPPGGSKCSGSCASEWHPLIASGTPTAGPGVQSSLLSTFKRSDGSEQVAYDKHALYTYTGQGPAAGAGVAADGGIWYLVAPSGKAIKATTGNGY